MAKIIRKEKEGAEINLKRRKNYGTDEEDLKEWISHLKKWKVKGLMKN